MGLGWMTLGILIYLSFTQFRKRQNRK
jgi:hypothetical protein